MESEKKRQIKKILLETEITLMVARGEKSERMGEKGERKYSY